MKFLQNVLADGIGTGDAGIESNISWSMESFLQNIGGKAQEWGSYFIVVLGIVMILVAGWQIGSGLMSHGKKQTNWAVAVVLLILGGAFAAGGFNLLSTVASGGKDTILDLGSVILPMFIR